MSRNENALRSPPGLFIGLRMKKNCMKGTSSVATSNEMNSTRVTAHGKLFRKSFIIPVVVNRNGKNVMLMASVAEKMDLKK